MRGRRLSTAAYLAARLGVSVRSVYRDVADLQLQGVPVEGWGPIEEAPAFDHSNLHFWEVGTTDMAGKLIDLSKRDPAVRVLDKEKDAKTIADYRTPEFVLGGWKPVVQ